MAPRWRIAGARRPRRLPEHPPYLAHFTTYTTVIPGPVGVQSSGSWSRIYNRAGTGPEVEDFLATVGTVAVDTGYAPDAATEVAVLEVVDELAAWLHDPTSTSPDPPEDGPYTLADGGFVLGTCPLENNRSNGQDLLNVMRGGRGTGGSAVNAIIVETRTTDILALRVWSGSGTSDAQTWSGIDSRIQTGTGSKASWLTVAVQWGPVASPQAWRVVMVADFDDGNGPTVILDDSFTEAVSDFASADNVTRLRFSASAAGAVFASTALSFADSTAAFEQAIIAHCYEASRVEITL